MFESVIALACIITGAEADPPCSVTAMHAVAVEMELMDEREIKWWGGTWSGFESSQIKILHDRYVQLHDAPPACDAARWPDRELCLDVIAFNRRYVEFLEERKKLFPGDTWIDEAIADSKRIITAYDLIRDCSCSYYYVSARREALAKLRDTIGSWNYYSGTLPPVVPVWHFRRID